MNSADFFWKLGDLFERAFVFYEIVQNHFNYFLLGLGFFGFFYWMFIQIKLSSKADVPSEVSNADFHNWYNGDKKQIK
jgi:hypothetical protein